MSLIKNSVRAILRGRCFFVGKLRYYSLQEKYLRLLVLTLLANNCIIKLLNNFETLLSEQG